MKRGPKSSMVGYLSIAERAWEKIFSVECAKSFLECRRGIRGAKVVGKGNLPGIEVTGLRGEFHRVDFEEGIAKTFRLTFIRANGKWLPASETLLRAYKLSKTYVL